jgi:hypoxanthine phosphoribosyltransferase
LKIIASGTSLPKIPIKLVSWEEIVSWSRGLAKKILESGWIPDVIIAVARGGYVPARLLCDFLGIENLLSIQSQHWTEAAKVAEKAIIKFPYSVDLSGLKALLVDDIVDTGDTLLLAKQFIQENWRPKDLRIAALQWISPVAKFKPDYYYIEVKEWIWFQYPWTRVEDISQFIKRLFSEENIREPVSLDMIKKKFVDAYGIEPEEFYFHEAIDLLIRKKIFAKTNDNKYVFIS